MGHAVAVRTDFTAGEVRRFAKRAKDTAQAADCLRSRRFWVDHCCYACDMEELLAEAIRRSEEVEIEAIVVADERGRHVASVPVVTALPAAIVTSLRAN